MTPVERIFAAAIGLERSRPGGVAREILDVCGVVTVDSDWPLLVPPEGMTRGLVIPASGGVVGNVLGPVKTPTPFVAFKKIPRLSREVVVTEKIDGTNASIFIGDDGEFLTGSRTRWITPEADNHGFSRWAHANKDELMKLGPGMHYGEWWGSGIQRGYGLKEKRFSLFNTARWSDPAVRPACCHVVPVLYTGPFCTSDMDWTLAALALTGSSAAPGFRNPEGIVIFHVAGNLMFKKTLENDGVPKAALAA